MYRNRLLLVAFALGLAICGVAILRRLNTSIPPEPRIAPAASKGGPAGVQAGTTKTQPASTGPSANNTTGAGREAGDHSGDGRTADSPQDVQSEIAEACEGLSGEDATELHDILDGALGAQAAVLIATLLRDGRSGNRRAVSKSALCLTWALAHNPQGLHEIERSLLDSSQATEVLGDLVAVVGNVGTVHARRALIEWLRLPQLERIHEQVLLALYREPQSGPGEIARCFRVSRTEGEGGGGVPKFDAATTDEVTLRTTLDLLSPSTPPQIRRTAASLLSFVVGDKKARRTMDDALWSQIKAELVEVIASSNDWGFARSCTDGLASVRDPECSRLIWREFNRTDIPPDDHATLGKFVAFQAVSFEEVQHVLDVMQREQSPLTRAAMLRGLKISEFGPPESREAMARIIADMAQHETDASVRWEALLRLQDLRPESDSFAAWALNDKDEQIRTAAQQRFAPK